MRSIRSYGLVGYCLAGALLFGSNAAYAGDAPETIDPSTMTPSFTEDFDSLDVSPWGDNGSRWIAHTPYSGDFGDAKFTDPVEGFPFTTQDGILHIEARKGDDGKWRSGLLASVNRRFEGFSQKNGYFEARMKLPAGKGVWPAFWLVGTDRSAHTAEIDVLEHYGALPARFSSKLHIWQRTPGKESSSQVHLTNVERGSLSSAYHTYGVLLDPDHVTFYFDREKIWQVDRPAEADMPFYVMVNLALGSGWPITETPNPSVLDVDYIHAFREK